MGTNKNHQKGRVSTERKRNGRRESPTQAELTESNNFEAYRENILKQTNKNTNQGRSHSQENGYNRVIEQYEKDQNNPFSILEEIMK